jgi:hypothetical protein
MPTPRKRDERDFTVFIAFALPHQLTIAYMIEVSREAATLADFLIGTVNRTHRSALPVWNRIVNIGILTKSGDSSASAGVKRGIPRPGPGRGARAGASAPHHVRPADSGRGVPDHQRGCGLRPAFYRRSTDSLIATANLDRPAVKAQWRGGDPDPIRGPRFDRLLLFNNSLTPV